MTTIGGALTHHSWTSFPPSIYLDVVESTQDPANNRSYVTVTVRLVYNTGGTGNSNTSGGTIFWNVGFTSGSLSANYDHAGWSAVVWQGWVSHDGAGAYSNTMALSAVYPGNSADEWSGSYALTTLVQAPTAPTSVTDTRNSDTKSTVNWTNSATAGHTPTGAQVGREIGAATTPTVVATLGLVGSYADTALAANQKVRHFVRNTNTAGASAWAAAAAPIFTTPAAPSNVTLTRDGSGNPVVSFTDNVAYSEHDHLVQFSTDAGTTWTAGNSVAAVATGATATYTLTGSSNAATYLAKVTARPTASGFTTLVSSSVVSNSLSAINTAHAPTLLSPLAVIDPALAQTFAWVHNPADGTDQSKYELQWSTDGGTTVHTIGPTSTTQQTYSLAGGTISVAAGSFVWRVATAGQNGTLGAFSPWQSVNLATTPQVTITSPDAGTIDTSLITPEWTFFQAEGQTQTAWQASVTDLDGNMFLTASGSDNSNSFTEGKLLAADTAYVLTVTVQASSGLWSAADTVTFTPDYPAPADVILTPVFDRASGTMILTLDVTTPDDDHDPQDRVTIYRTINGVQETVVKDLSVAGQATVAVLDMLPQIRGENAYQVEVWSALPGISEMDPVTIDPQEKRLGYLNVSATEFGADFSQVYKCWGNLTPQLTASREKDLLEFEGDTLPTARRSVMRSSVYDLTVDLLVDDPDSATFRDFIDACLNSGRVCWRDAKGNRVYGELGEGRASLAAIIDGLALTLTETAA